jgi:16S rRNA (uracil1498-N3)-methyltransferase
MRSTNARSSTASKTRSRGNSAASRFFIGGVRAPGERVELDAADARKIRVVLRMQSGAAIEAVDSAGVSYAGTITVEADAVSVHLDAVLERAVEPELRITIAQGVPKGQKMDFAIEKATEVGVAAFVPFFSARTAGEHVGAAKLERWRRIARSAAAQSGRTFIPEVADPIAWPALLERFGSYDRVLIAWEVADRDPLWVRLPAIVAGAKSLLAVIGPEGGLSHDEVEAARARGAEIVSLGARILRTETAGLVAAVAILFAAHEV